MTRVCINNTCNILGEKETFESSTTNSHSWLSSFISEIELLFNEFITSYEYELDDIMFISFSDMLALIKKTMLLNGDTSTTNAYYTYLNALLMKSMRNLIYRIR